MVQTRVRPGGRKFYGDIARLKKPQEETIESGTPDAKVQPHHAASALMPQRGDASAPGYLDRGPASGAGRGLLGIPNSGFPSDLVKTPAGAEVGIMQMSGDTAAGALGVKKKRIGL